MLVYDLLDIIENNKRRYEKNKKLNIIAVGLNVIAAIFLLIRGRWYLSVLNIVCAVALIVTFLRYRKSHLCFLEYFSSKSGKKVV